MIPWELDPRDEREAEMLRVQEERYRFACPHVRGKRVLDLACGVGRGSRLLAQDGEAASVLGMDIDPSAIALATKHYAGERVQFLCAPYQEVPRDPGFDVIVSLETIEHTAMPGDFLRCCRLALRPDGLLIGSVPVTPTTDFNPYHLHDFTRGSIRRLLRRSGFRVIAQRVQVERVRLQATRFVQQHARGRGGWLRLAAKLLPFYARHPVTLWRRLAATVLYGFDVRCLLFVAAPAGAASPDG